MKNFVLDVDGVFTDGTFYYTAEGKVMKRFGADDNDALGLLAGKLQLLAVTGDRRGFAITKRRIADDMKLPLELVSTAERVAWLKSRFDLTETVYMGDGILDVAVFRAVGYSIAPANSLATTKQAANFVTTRRGGEGAVAEAVLHVLEKFFEPADLAQVRQADERSVWHA